MRIIQFCVHIKGVQFSFLHYAQQARRHQCEKRWKRPRCAYYQPLYISQSYVDGAHLQLHYVCTMLPTYIFIYCYIFPAGTRI